MGGEGEGGPVGREGEGGRLGLFSSPLPGLFSSPLRALLPSPAWYSRPDYRSVCWSRRWGETLARRRMGMGGRRAAAAVPPSPAAPALISLSYFSSTQPLQNPAAVVETVRGACDWAFAPGSKLAGKVASRSANVGDASSARACACAAARRGEAQALAQAQARRGGRRRRAIVAFARVRRGERVAR